MAAVLAPSQVVARSLDSTMTTGFLVFKAKLRKRLRVAHGFKASSRNRDVGSIDASFARCARCLPNAFRQAGGSWNATDITNDVSFLTRNKHDCVSGRATL